MGPLGIPPSKSQPRPEGRKEGEHSTAKPPLPHHRKKPTTQNPKGRRKPNVFMGKHFTNGALGLSIALSGSVPAESPVEPLVLKLVRCLVLINELRIPHPCALSWPLQPVEWEPTGEAGRRGRAGLQDGSTDRQEDGGTAQLGSHLQEKEHVWPLEVPHHPISVWARRPSAGGDRRWRGARGPCGPEPNMASPTRAALGALALERRGPGSADGRTPRRIWERWSQEAGPPGLLPSGPLLCAPTVRRPPS